MHPPSHKMAKTQSVVTTVFLTDLYFAFTRLPIEPRRNGADYKSVEKKINNKKIVENTPNRH